MNTWKTILILVVVSIPSTLLATDWNDCRNGLSGIAIDLTTTEKTAAELNRMESELETLRASHQECMDNPGVYDVLQNGCKNQLDDYNALVDEYNAKLPAFKNELYTMVETLKAALPRCDY